MSKLTRAGIIGALLTAAVGAPASAQISVTWDNPVSVYFSGYGGAGFAPTPGPGQLDSDAWIVTGLSDGEMAFGDTRDSGDFARGASSGGVTTGGLYAFSLPIGFNGFGVQATSSDLTPGALVLRLVNDAGAPVTGLDLGATVYVLNDGDRSASLVAEWAFSLDGPWTAFTTPLVTPEAAAGAPAWTSASLSGVTAPGFVVPAGDEVLVRFLFDDAAGSGARDELAIASITITPSICGNRIVEPGETCDPDFGDPTPCDPDCSAVVCGDGLLNTAAGEECDTGGPSALCDADCSAAWCGDGTANSAAGEECDPGASPLLDTGAGGNGVVGLAGITLLRAQTFILAADTAVDTVQLEVTGLAGACEGLEVEIVAAPGGVPDPSTLLASGAVRGALPPFDFTDTVARAPLYVTLPAGDYAVLVDHTTSAGACSLRGSDDDPYAAGRFWSSSPAAPSTLEPKAATQDVHVALLPNPTGVVSATCEQTCRDVRCADGLVNTAAGEACDPGPAAVFDTSTTGGQSPLSDAGTRFAQTITLYGPLDVVQVALDADYDHCLGALVRITGVNDNGTPDLDDLRASGTLASTADGVPARGWSYAQLGAALEAGSWAVVFDVAGLPDCHGYTNGGTTEGGVLWVHGEAASGFVPTTTDLRLQLLTADVALDTATCDADCSEAVCGDGYTNVEAGEQCDTDVATALCDVDCSHAQCGDGLLNPAAFEECDDGEATFPIDSFQLPDRPGYWVQDAEYAYVARNNTNAVDRYDLATWERSPAALFSGSEVAPFESCGGGGDEDGDGLADCEDPDCVEQAMCSGLETCVWNEDFDGDGLTACADPDCGGSGSCRRTPSDFDVLALNPVDGGVAGATNNGDGIAGGSGIYLFDGETGAFRHAITSELTRWLGLAFTPSGDLYAAQTEDVIRFRSRGEGRTWERLGVALTLPTSLSRHPLACDPDGVVYAAHGETVTRIEGDTGEILGTLTLPDAVTQMIFDEDGLMWASLHGGGLVHVDPVTGEVVAARAPDGSYDGVLFGAPDRLWAFASSDGTVEVYRARENSDTLADACRTSCQLPSCGDGVVDSGEECDDGGETAGCNADCTRSYCGDGVINGALGEECDDGGPSSTCDANCTVAVCGDLDVNAAAGEACDPGSTPYLDTSLGAGPEDRVSMSVSAYAQTVTLSGPATIDAVAVRATDAGCDGLTVRILGVTGGGAPDPGVVLGEATVTEPIAWTVSGGVGWWPVPLRAPLDQGSYAVELSGVSACQLTVAPSGPYDGGALWTTPSGEASWSQVVSAGDLEIRLYTAGAFAVGTPGCTATCQETACGDGLVNPGAGEDCDPPGETASCDADCTAVVCGDGWRNVAAGEACDDGDDNSDTAADACRTDCELARCGDGAVDTDEACDDGDANSDSAADACRTDCALPSCGDGVIDGDEACDDGDDNSDTEPNACRTLCLAPSCGDGVVDSGETCDDGPGNSDVLADACRSSCTVAGCGDGVVDSGEGCDDGGDNSDLAPNACRTSCEPAGCGDGVKDTGEACDAGAGNSDTTPDACRTDCVAPSCGDGVKDSSEACDAGVDNSDTVPDACRVGCLLAGCGDGVVDSGEGCDDGDANSDSAVDACRMDCSEAGCGDGVVDSGEGCDDGDANSDSAVDACRLDCSEAGCGDGVVDTGEACDDGDDNSDTTPDACRTSCVVASCGDGVVDDGEACDDGGDNSDVAPDACRTGCVAPSCGDGVIDDGEGCDNGAANSDSASGACRTDCTPATCGDGVVDPNEACDDGEDNSDTAVDACRLDCAAAGCGDGVVDSGEGCDDGDANSDAVADACRTDCAVASCGDGVLDSGEGCDDGGESASCNADCAVASCGDGVVNVTAGETCDDGGESASCDLDCSAAECGDGVVNASAGEGCDGGEACDASCQPETTKVGGDEDSGCGGAGAGAGWAWLLALLLLVRRLPALRRGAGRSRRG